MNADKNKDEEQNNEVRRITGILKLFRFFHVMQPKSRVNSSEYLI